MRAESLYTIYYHHKNVRKLYRACVEGIDRGPFHRTRGDALDYRLAWLHNRDVVRRQRAAVAAKEAQHATTV